jgi:hypothetical protein
MNPSRGSPSPKRSKKLTRERSILKDAWRHESEEVRLRYRLQAEFSRAQQLRSNSLSVYNRVAKKSDRSRVSVDRKKLRYREALQRGKRVASQHATQVSWANVSGPYLTPHKSPGGAPSTPPTQLSDPLTAETPEIPTWPFGPPQDPEGALQRLGLTFHEPPPPTPTVPGFPSPLKADTPEIPTWPYGIPVNREQNGMSRFLTLKGQQELSAPFAVFEASGSSSIGAPSFQPRMAVPVIQQWPNTLMSPDWNVSLLAKHSGRMSHSPPLLSSAPLPDFALPGHQGGSNMSGWGSSVTDIRREEARLQEYADDLCDYVFNPRGSRN